MQSADFLLLHADSTVQKAQSGEHGGLHADRGVWLPVALHRAYEGLPSATGVASVPAVAQRLLNWHCTGRRTNGRLFMSVFVKVSLSTELIYVPWTC